MNSFDFEKSGYITKRPLCHSSRSVLEDNSYEYFGVSLPHKYSNGYFNYLLKHEIVEKNFFWKIDSLFGDKKDDSWTISILFLREDNCKAYEKLRSFLYHFTNESVRKALASSPNLAELLINAYSSVKFRNKEIYNRTTCIGLSFCIYHFNIGKYYSELTEKDDANILCEYANIIRKELNSFSLDSSKLENKPKEEPFLPNWLSKTINVGGRIGLKVLCAQLGANIGGDLFGNVDGGDYSVGTDFSDMSEFDLSDEDFVASNNYGNNSYLTNDGYNVSFGSSANSDGYIHQGNISLERTISGITDSFPHYTKGGADFVKIGNSYIRIDSGTTVTIKNVKYDCI